MATSEGEIGNQNEGTCTLLQKGSNYDKIEENKSKKYEFGKLVCFNEECFNIISSDKKTVTMLAVHRINPDVNNPVQNLGANTYSYSSSPYWYNGSKVKEEYGGKYPAYIYDNNYYIYEFLEAYKLYLEKNNNLSSLDIKLLNYEDTLKFPSKSILKKGYDWWTGSASLGNNQYVVTSGGGFGLAGWCTQKQSIVPVITVDKREINL